MKNRNPNKVILAIKKLGAKILFSYLIGSIIAILYRNKIPCYDFTVDTSPEFFPAKSKAAIFFRSYESAELRFVRKYLEKKYDVIELGSSFGIVSSQIASKLRNSDKRLICVEPNKILVGPLEANLAINGDPTNCHVVNKIVDYESSNAFAKAFQVSENILVSKKVQSGDVVEESILVEKTTLTEIIDKYGISKYCLVMDIEGSEIEILLNEKNALTKCERIIVELHDTTFGGIDYSIDDMINLIQTELNFHILEGYGPVIVFERNEK